MNLRPAPTVAREAATPLIEWTRDPDRLGASCSVLISGPDGTYELTIRKLGTPR